MFLIQIFRCERKIFVAFKQIQIIELQIVILVSEQSFYLGSFLVSFGKMTLMLLQSVV